MAKVAQLLTDTQLPLAPAIHSVHSEAGKRIRALLNHAIASNGGMTHATLSEETGIDEKQIGRALRDDGGAHPPLSLVACILAKDRQGVVVQGLAAMCGWEAKRRQPDPAAENKRLREELVRLREELNRVLEGVQS